jgi:hypothetical protein
MNSAGLLTQLARRAVAAPEVQPRLASRFELAPAAIVEPRQTAPQAPADPAPERPPVVTWPASPALPTAPALAHTSRPAQTPEPELPPPSRPTAQAAAAPVQPQVTVTAQHLLPIAPPTAKEAGVRGADLTQPLPAGPVARPVQSEPPREAAGHPEAMAPRVRSEGLQALTITPPPAPGGGAATAPAQRPDAVRHPPATAHVPQAPQRERLPPAPPPIEITIGRIDVRAVQEAPPAAPRAATPAPAAPRTLGLADYLRQRPS